jgi:hypothetical protein
MSGGAYARHYRRAGLQQFVFRLAERASYSIYERRRRNNSPTSRANSIISGHPGYGKIFISIFRLRHNLILASFRDRDAPQLEERYSQIGSRSLGPFLPCRSRSGWKDEKKTAPMEATGNILARYREGKMEIPRIITW